MIYDILEDKLSTIGFEIGNTLFRNVFPGDVSIGIMIRTPLGGVKIDPGIPGWYRPDMQIVTRHIDPYDGYNMALQVQKVLTFQGSQSYPKSIDRGPAKLTLFFPETLPIQFPRLEGNGIEWSQMFNTAFCFELPSQ